MTGTHLFAHSGQLETTGVEAAEAWTVDPPRSVSDLHSARNTMADFLGDRESGFLPFVGLLWPESQSAVDLLDTASSAMISSIRS